MRWERRVSLTALLALGGSIIYMIFQQEKTGQPDAATGPFLQTTLPAGSATPADPVLSKTWAMSPAQSRGEAWVFDLFTPPEINYTKESKRWQVSFPWPDRGRVLRPENEMTGLVLAEILPAPYRVQLVGYAGAGSQLKGIFAGEESSELILAAAGTLLPQEEIEIISLTLHRETPPSLDGTTLAGNFITAVVHDLRTNKRIEHAQFTTASAGDLAARFENRAGYWRLGAEIDEANSRYRITQLSAEPAWVELTCISGANRDRRYILRTRSAIESTEANSIPTTP